MEACGVVDRSRFLQTQGFVRCRTNPLGTVDGTRLQRLVNFTTGHGDRRGTQLRNSDTAQAWHPVLQTFPVSSGVDFLTEPATTLKACVTSEEGTHAEFLVGFVHQLLATTMVHPGVQFDCGHPERNGSEEAHRHALADVVVGGRVVGVSCTRGHGIERTLRAGRQLAICLKVNFKRPISDLAYVVCKALSCIMYTKGAAAPGGNHGDLFTTLSKSWGRQASGCSRASSYTSDACASKKLTTFH